MLAIIGGSGMSRLEILEGIGSTHYSTPFSDSGVELFQGSLDGFPVIFLPRHGSGHRIPPHRIEYRANLWALKEQGVTDIVAINAVGGINPQMSPGQLAIPDQLIDYTWGRSHTFYEDDLTEVVHIDFTQPYSRRLRHLLVLAVEQEQLEEDEGEDGMPVTRGIYGCVQGPRLETAAEIQKLRADGCDMVGMTAMPEAALARELGIHYACLALSVNRAAGLDDEVITMEAINRTLASGMQEIRKVLRVFVRLYQQRLAVQTPAGEQDTSQ